MVALPAVLVAWKIREPLLVMVTLWLALTVPRFWLPKLSAAGVTLMTGTIGVAMAILRPWLAWPRVLVARRVKVKMPAVVGIPVMAPVVVFKFRPDGSVPVGMDQAMGAKPVATGVKL